MNKDDKHKEFSDWLASRMKDADLTAEDRKVFADWIMKEQPTNLTRECLPEPTKITMHEVRELFSWLKQRITSSSINEKERKLFNEWLTQRVTDHKHVDRDEFHKIKRDHLD